MRARMEARLRCLYARTSRRCPVLRAGCMGASEATYRLYSCGCCARQVRICCDCDRGNRYCATGCARTRRRESLHRAGERYQLGYRGACRHAARQRAWRARQAQKVTHQGSLAAAVTRIVVHGESASHEAQVHGGAPALSDSHLYARWPVQRTAPVRPRCCFCGRRLPRFTRLGPLRAGP
jgi:hypothetical protein